ncbi:MAG TPA: hypothetical protein VMB26_03630 [Candidatus Binataceae bacterium]|nr:hypothetical protein [Candidatus Binataceae bacterium]
MDVLFQRVAVAGALLWTCLMLASVPAHAQVQNIYPGFFELADPQVFNAFAFGGGYGSPKYGMIQEGFQAEQSVTPYLGLVSRVTGYQVWVGDHFNNPMVPEGPHDNQLNFGRFQGGMVFALYPGTRLFVFGGHDIGDAYGTVIEGDLSSWWFIHSQHPINFSFSAVHNYQNHVTSAEIDPRVVALATDNYLFTAGAGGAIYQGGAIHAAQGQGGIDLGVYFRKWGFGVDIQSGYGTADGYGELTFEKQWSFLE